MDKDKNLETAVRDAERNYSVGRILDAARDFQTISIIFGGMKDYVSAARYAVKSGDCWVECGDPLRAASQYESAAHYFEMLGDEGKYRVYYRKALVQCVLADRRGEGLGKAVRARNLRRAAVCQSKIDDSVSVSHYYGRAAEFFVSAARDSVEKEMFDEAFSLYMSAAECYSRTGEYPLAVGCLADALACLAKLSEEYRLHLEEEEYREIMKREEKRFDSTIGELLEVLEGVDGVDDAAVERMWNSLLTVLRVGVALGRCGENLLRLLERGGSMAHVERASVLEILDEIISSCDSDGSAISEGVFKVVKRLREVLER